MHLGYIIQEKQSPTRAIIGMGSDDDEYVEESYIDEFGNKKARMVPKIKDESLKRMQKGTVQKEAAKNASQSNNLTSRTITVTDAYGNKIQKQVLVDDQGNIIDEIDIEYVKESYIDEFGNKKTRIFYTFFIIKL